jgi:hypothetical protein
LEPFSRDGFDDQPAMDHRLRLTILPQPNDSTCGPTCLQALYEYWSDPLPLEQVIREVGELNEGGTLAVQLACHALQRGYRATIYTFNLQVFDPTWFRPGAGDLAEKLRAQREAKRDSKLRIACDLYLQFLQLGGTVHLDLWEEAVIDRALRKGRPILTGLSATYLYQDSRERVERDAAGGHHSVPDDIAGVPVGHFVVLCGYNRRERRVLVADPLWPNPMSANHYYTAPLNLVATAILLGIVTYDANLLILEPPDAGGVSQ